MEHDASGKGKRNNIRNIRYYILSLLYQNGLNSVRVPSSVELAKMFGVVRRTACMALQGMIKEGYLIGKVGIGTFTNPKQAFKVGRSPQLPLLAIGLEDCAHFYFDARIANDYARMSDAVIAHGANVYPLIHSSHDFALLADEIKNTHVDGLILHSPFFSQAQMASLQKLDIPIATIGESYSGCTAILPDEKESAKRLAASFLKTLPEGGRILYTYKSHSLWERIVKAAIEDVQPTRSLQCIATNHEESKYEEMLGSHLRRHGMPDALVIGFRHVWIVHEVLKQFAPSEIERCHILVAGIPAGPLPFPASLYHPDSHAMANAAVQDILARLQDRSRPTSQIHVPFQLRICAHGKEDYSTLNP